MFSAHVNNVPVVQCLNTFIVCGMLNMRICSRRLLSHFCGFLIVHSEKRTTGGKSLDRRSYIEKLKSDGSAAAEKGL